MTEEYGFIPLSRKMVDGHDELWESAEPFDSRSAWIDLLFLARFAPGIAEGERLERGEFLASVRFLAQRWRWGRASVHSYLRKLQNTGRIAERRIGRRGAVYMVVNYATYNPREGKPRTPKRTPDRTEAGQQPDKDKERIKKEDVALNALVDEGRGIWKAEMGGELAYGRVKKLFKGLRADGHSPETILAHLRELFRRNQRAQDKQFIRLETWASQFGLYTPPGTLSVVQGGLSDEERYAFLVAEAQRGMDMGDAKKYPDWPTFRDRYWRGEKPKVSRGTLRPAS